MRLSYGRMFTDKLDGQHGIARSRLADLVQRFPAVIAEVDARNGRFTIVSHRSARPIH